MNRCRPLPLTPPCGHRFTSAEQKTRVGIAEWQTWAHAWFAGPSTFYRCPRDFISVLIIDHHSITIPIAIPSKFAGNHRGVSLACCPPTERSPETQTARMAVPGSYIWRRTRGFERDRQCGRLPARTNCKWIRIAKPTFHATASAMIGPRRL